MSEYSERELVFPAIIAMGNASGKMSTTELISVLTDVLQPDGKDAQIIEGRGDSYFSQKVRNLKAHNTLGKHGYANTTDDGWELNETGWFLYEKVSSMLKKRGPMQACCQITQFHTLTFPPSVPSPLSFLLAYQARAKAASCANWPKPPIPKHTRKKKTDGKITAQKTLSSSK